MNSILQKIFFVVFSLIIVGCGNGAKDNRIVLSSQSSADEKLLIPSGECEDCEVSVHKLEVYLAGTSGQVATVSDLSFSRGVMNYIQGTFTTSFTVATKEGKIYAGVECTSESGEEYLDLLQCGSDEARFRDWIRIPFEAILAGHHYKNIILPPTEGGSGA